MKWNRDDVDKYKASKESKTFIISAFIDKNQAAFETAPVDRIGLKDTIKTFVLSLSSIVSHLREFHASHYLEFVDLLESL